jgi:membrane associated rhomboid family serine protease
MMLRGDATFSGAPVSLALCCVCLCSILLEMVDAKAALCVESFGGQVLSRSWGWYRLWTHQLVVSSSASLFLLLVLFAQFRAVERMLGTRQFVSFVGLTALGAPLLLLMAAMLSFDPYVGVISGPVSLVFGLLVLFVRLSPLDCTPLLALQLLLATGPRGVLHALAGLAFGGLFFQRRSLLPVAMTRLLFKR